MTKPRPPRDFVSASGVSANFDDEPRSPPSSRKGNKNRREDPPSDLPDEDEADVYVTEGRNKMLIPLSQRSDISEQQRENQVLGAKNIVSQYDRFEKDLPNILQLLDGKEQDGAISAINKSLLISVLAVVPKAISKYEQTGMEFHAYALGAILTQIRNLIADLQAGRDRSVVSERINKVLIKGAFVMMTQHFSELNSVLKSELSDKVKPEYIKTVSVALDANLRSQARFMMEIYDELSENVSKILTE